MVLLEWDKCTNSASSAWKIYLQKKIVNAVQSMIENLKANFLYLVEGVQKMYNGSENERSYLVPTK